MHNGKCKQQIFLFAVCCKVCVAIFYAIYVTFNVMLNNKNIWYSLCPYRPKHLSILSSALEMIGCICQAKSLGEMKR